MRPDRATVQAMIGFFDEFIPGHLIAVISTVIYHDPDTDEIVYAQLSAGGDENEYPIRALAKILDSVTEAVLDVQIMGDVSGRGER